MIKFELVYRALSRSKSFSFIFIANFSLAILALFLLQFFKQSTELSLDAKSKDLIGADLVVTSRFPISEKQKENILELLPSVKSYNEGISTVSMIASKKRARLMEVVKLNKGFPYYGGLIFSDQKVFPRGEKLPNENQVWVYSEVLKLLDLKIGSSLKIGATSFKITKVIESDSLKSISFSGFMPRVYLSAEGLRRSEVIQFGSTARYKMNYQLQEDLSNDQLELLENKIEKKLDQNLKVLSPNDGRNRLVRVLGALTDFLSLVSLVSFFLGLVGLIYLYTGFLNKHQKDIKVLNDIGLSKTDLCLTYLFHLISLMAIATLFVFILIALVAPAISPIIQKNIDFDFQLSLDYLFFIKSSLALFILSLSIGIPLILPLLGEKIKSPLKAALSFAPFIAILLFLSHFVAPRQNIGLIFACATLIIIFILFTLGSSFLNLQDYSGHKKSLSLSLALKNIVRQKKTSLTLFSAILLCTALFSIIPQIGSSISKALKMSVNDRPRFFVIDAKMEQIEGLSKNVKELGASLDNISPMVRARIVKVNDLDFREHAKKVKLEDQDLDQGGDENELKNRAVNLSYRSSLKESEQIVEGRDFSGDYESSDFSKPVEVSVEERYARRRGLKLGDELVFDILGLELAGKVVNIRSVKWSEFVPNFFLILQNGAVNDAPKTVLATISEGNYDPQKMILTLSDLFPSLTIIDVKSLFEEFSKLISAVSSITDKMSLYSIMIGLLMSFIIIQYQMNLQKNNILRLKMIGVKNKILKNSLLLEFGIISVSASSLGIFLGSLGSYLISNFLFESYWDFRPDLLLLYFFLIPSLTLIVVNIFSSKIISQKENLLFGE